MAKKVPQRGGRRQRNSAVDRSSVAEIAWSQLLRMSAVNGSDKFAAAAQFLRLAEAALLQIGPSLPGAREAAQLVESARLSTVERNWNAPASTAKIVAGMASTARRLLRMVQGPNADSAYRSEPSRLAGRLRDRLASYLREHPRATPAELARMLDVLILMEGAQAVIPRMNGASSAERLKKWQLGIKNDLFQDDVDRRPDALAKRVILLIARIEKQPEPSRLFDRERKEKERGRAGASGQT